MQSCFRYKFPALLTVRRDVSPRVIFRLFRRRRFLAQRPAENLAHVLHVYEGQILFNFLRNVFMKIKNAVKLKTL